MSSHEVTDVGTSSPEPPRYAVLFRTHFWDDFSRRQLESLKKVVDHGDIFILVDDTNGFVADIDHPLVFRVSAGDFPRLGLPLLGEGAALWFNGDYPLYPFRKSHPEYDYYVQLEYDVILNKSVDALVEELRRSSADFLGLTKGAPSSVWFWRETCLGAYAEDAIEHQLICFSVFSGQALDFLYQRRLVLAAQIEAGAINSWPMCEGFIATELVGSGKLKLVELSALGDTSHYDHWPPYLESDVVRLKQFEFVHPVLDSTRYVASVLKNAESLKDLLNPGSLTHRKLRRLPWRAYLGELSGRPVRAAFQRALQRKADHFRRGYLLTPKSDLRA